MSQFDAPERTEKLEYGYRNMSGETSRDFFISGGTLPVDSPSYVERQADRVLYESLTMGRYCYVLNARQMGKSSLSVQTIGRLEKVGIRTAFIDLTRLGGKNVSAEQWYTGFALDLARELDLRREMTDYWKENTSVGPMQRLFSAIREVILSPGKDGVPAPLVVFIDEIDATRSLPFDPDEFFAAIRECFNRRVFDPAYGQLTFCLLGVAVPSDLIRNPATTPFNIGERVFVEDFTPDELKAFASKLGKNGEEVIERVHYWTGGHPFLSQSLCRSLARMSTAIDASAVDATVRRELFDFKVRDSNANLADVANIALHYCDAEPDALQFRADLLSAYQRIHTGKFVMDDESNRVAALLKLSGIARSDGRRLHVRNRIYRHVFDLAWIEENMPGQELKRQKQSYRRGVFRTAGISGAMIAVVAGLAAYAWSSRVAAIAAKRQLDYELYVADINSLRSFYDRGDTASIESILTRHRASSYRGFEWAYWQRRFHDAPEEYTLDYIAPGKREVGHISTNGKEICIVDLLTHSATIIDRATKRVVSRKKVGPFDEIGQLDGRWVRFIGRLGRTEIVDLLSGVVLHRLGSPGFFQQAILHDDHSDIVLTSESLENHYEISKIGIWNAAKGSELAAIRIDALGGFLSISPDGDFFSYGRALSDRAGQNGIEVTLAARRTGAVIDRFMAPTDATLVCLFPKSHRILFKTTVGRLFLRDTNMHRTDSVPAYTEGSPETVESILGERSTLSLNSNGHCVVRDFPSGDHERVRGNVSEIGPGADDNEFLASATSVKIYRASDSASAQVIAHGYRVTRFNFDQLNVFVANPNTIRRVSEANYSAIGELPPPTTKFREYSYNGRWSLGDGPDGKQNQLIDAEGILPPKRLPIHAAIWACGTDPSHFAIWDQDHLNLELIDASTGKLKWRREMRTMQAMWISPDGTRLLAVRDNIAVDAFDTETGKLLKRVEAHNMGPIYVTFTRDSNRFFTCGGDGRAVMWDLHAIKKLREFRGNALNGVTCADLSPDGTRVVTASRSGWWQLWDASTGAQLLDVDASGQPLSSVLFCSDGARVLSAGSDNQVRVWSASDQNPTVLVPIDRSWLAEVHE